MRDLERRWIVLVVLESFRRRFVGAAGPSADTAKDIGAVGAFQVAGVPRSSSIRMPWVGLSRIVIVGATVAHDAKVAFLLSLVSKSLVILVAE